MYRSFHKTHAKECAASSTAECLYTCHRCWDKTGNAPLDAPVQRSGRNTERSFKLCLRTQRRRGKHAESEKEWWMKDIPKEKRAVSHSSYWLNGLHVSKRRDDPRLIQFGVKCFYGSLEGTLLLILNQNAVSVVNWNTHQT